MPPGIGAYRDALAKTLANQPAQALPHEQIIGKLDEAGKVFKVLLIKNPADTALHVGFLPTGMRLSECCHRNIIATPCARRCNNLLLCHIALFKILLAHLFD
jgi:hypothetical protein